MKKIFFVLLILFGVAYSLMSSGIISSKAPSPEWVYVDGEYYWDGDDTHVWDYDNGVLWEWDRDTNTWTYIRDIP